jgi:murein DD-endopeptidase MepM/ murein hydrolase activator NlpD
VRLFLLIYSGSHYFEAAPSLAPLWLIEGLTLYLTDILNRVFPGENEKITHFAAGKKWKLPPLTIPLLTMTTRHENERHVYAIFTSQPGHDSKMMRLFIRFVFAAFAGLLTASPASPEGCGTGNQLQHPAQGEIYRNFGCTTHPLLKTLRFHTGLDYKGDPGDPVSATEAGTVTIADRLGGYGNYVRIDHGNGLQTTYGHLLNLSVKPGQCVNKGEVIALLGNSGLSSEPHLHFEVIQAIKFADPCSLLPDHRGCQIRDMPQNCRGRDIEPGNAIDGE